MYSLYDIIITICFIFCTSIFISLHILLLRVSLICANKIGLLLTYCLISFISVDINMDFIN